MPDLFPFWSNLAHGKKKNYERTDVSHDHAQPLGINVRVARGYCDALMAQERLHVTQVGSRLVEQERGGRLTQRVRGNDWHLRALAGELEACVERLVAKGRAVSASKDERRSREVNSLRSRTPLTLSRKANHPPGEPDNSLVSGKSRNEPPLTWRR
jgi:hypothetical protein